MISIKQIVTSVSYISRKIIFKLDYYLVLIIPLIIGPTNILNLHVPQKTIYAKGLFRRNLCMTYMLNL